MIHTRLASVRFLLGFRPVLLLGILLGLGTAGLRAQFTFTWDGGPDSSYSGNWNDAQDWTANVGLPGPFDTAKFDINQTYTVNVGAAVLLSKVEVTAGDLTFNVAAGRELFINTELKVNSATLRVQGSAVTARHASLTNATLRLDGGVLILTEENSPINGLVEQGTLRVEGNGRIEANLDGYASPSNIINSASQSVIRANGGDLLVMLAPLTTQPGEERRILFSDIQDSERVWFGDVETQGNRLTFDAGLYRPEGTEELKWRRLELRRGVTLVGGILATAGGTIYFGPGISGSGRGAYADSTIRGHGLIETPNSITLDVASISLDGPLNFKGSAGIQIFNLAAEVTNVEIGPNLLTFESQKAVSAKSVYFNLDQGEVRAEKGWDFRFRQEEIAAVGFGGVGLIRGKIVSEMTAPVAGDPSASTREDSDSALLFHPTGSVVSIGNEAIGAGGLSVLSTTPVRIDGLVTLAGGELRSVNGWTFGPDGGINGSGIVFGAVSDSTKIHANGVLSDIQQFYSTGATGAVPIYFGGAIPMLVLSTGVTTIEAPLIETSVGSNSTVTHKLVTADGGLLWAPGGMNLLALNFSGSGELRGPVSGTGSLTLGGGFLVGDSASTTGVAYSGNVSVGAHTLTLRDADFASLGGATTIAGGTITAANGLTLPAGSTLSGFGTVAGSMWNAGTITATGGDLTLGSTTGTYFSDPSGVLNVGAEKVTLLGTSVTLGNSTTLVGGQLFAPSGFVYDTTRKVSGYGIIRTENSVGLDATMATPTGALTVGTNVAVGTDTLTFLSNADTVLNAALTLAGGRLTGSGFGLAIGGTGSVSGYGTINQPVANGGTINVSAGQQLTINGLFANTGTVNPTGTLRLTAGGSLGGTFGAGSLALAGGTYALASGLAMPSGLTVTLQGSTLDGPGALQVGSGSTLQIASGGGTLNAPVSNSGTLSVNGAVTGTGTITNQGLIESLGTVIGVQASIANPLTNTSGGTVSVPLGKSLTVSGAVNNSGLITVAGTPTLRSELRLNGPLTNSGTLEVNGELIVAGAATHTGTANVAGRLVFGGGGSSTGALALNGGIVQFNSPTFSVPNAATSITGVGALTFGAGTTTLGYGAINGPLTIAQSLVFSGGDFALPTVTSLRLHQLALRGAGQTPDMPTTVQSGGVFVWETGTVRNTLTLAAGSMSTSATVDTVNSVDASQEVPGLKLLLNRTIDGTLVNQTSTLKFEQANNGQPTAGVGGSGTLRNEGAVSIAMADKVWTPTIDNPGTATLTGTFGTVNNTGTLTLGAGSGANTLSLLNQTAGMLTILGYQVVTGQTWTIGTGTTVSISGGAWLRVAALNNLGTMVFEQGAVTSALDDGMRNLAGGVLHLKNIVTVTSPVLEQNAGMIILDGAGANLGMTFSSPGAAAANPILPKIGGGTLEVRNGSNQTLNDGIGAAASLVAGAGGTFNVTGGTLNGPGALSILSGGVVNNSGGATWGARPITNAGTFNVTGAVNVANGTALTFANLAGGVMNITSNFNAGAGGSSAALTNAADGTIRKVSGSPGFFDLIYGNGAVVNHGLVEVQAGTGLMALKNLTNDGTLRAAAGTELWIDGGSLLAGTILDGAGTFRFRENTTTIGAGLTLSAKDLWIEGGTLTGAGAITVRIGDVLRFSHGTLNGTGGLSILSGGVVNNGGGTWGARPITNAGTFNVTGAVNVANGTALTFDNLAGGVVNITGNFNAGAGGSSAALTNAADGTIRKVSGSPGFFDLIYGNGTVVNHGLVEVQAGTGLMAMKNLTNDGTLRAAAGTELWIDGGSLLAGTILDGAGTFRFRENTTTLGAGFVMSAKDLWIEGGTLTGAGAITVRSGDVLRFSHGTLNGTGGLSILSGGVVNNGGAAWGARPITNAGTFNVTGAVNVANGTALAFDNLAGGVVNITGNFNASAGGSGLALTNATGGTIRKVSGSPGFFDLIYGNGAVVNHGLVEVQAGTGLMAMKNLTNDGTLRAAAGTELWIDGGSLLAGTILDGAGTFRFRENTTTIGAGFVMSAKDLWIEGGTLTGAGAITVRSGDVLRFSHGTLNGTGGLSILSGGVVNNGGGVWGARPITNAGTFNVTGAVNVANGTALTFDNLAGGVVNIVSNFNASAGGSSLALTNAAGGTVSKVSGSPGFFDLIYGNGTLVNHGLVEVQAGTGLMALKNLTNDGTLRAVAGTEMFISSGTLLPGTVLDGAGTFRFRENTTTIGAGLALSAKDLWIESGTVTGPGAITVRSGDVMRFTSGALNGTGGLSILSGGVLTNNGGGVWGARPVTNAGTFNVTGAVNLTNGTALTFDNQAGGVVELNNSYQFLNAGGPGQWAELVNAVGATIRKIGGTTEYDLIYGEGTFVNRGSVEVNSGFLRASVTMPSGQLSEGTWRVTNGAQLILNGDAAITRNAATVVLTGANSLFNGLNSLTNNSGSLSLLGGRAFTTSAAFTNSGTMIVGSGSAFSTSGTFTNTGTLDVTGSFSAGGGLVAAGTLGGIGTFGSLTTLASGGTIAPGNSPGTLTFGAGLTLQAGSVLDFQLGTTSDLIVVSGGLLTGPTTGKVTLNLSNSGGFFAGAYTLINYATASGTASFDATDFSLGSTIPGFSYGLALSGNTLQLTASAIPEPSTYAAILGAVVLGLAWWWRGDRRAQ